LKNPTSIVMNNNRALWVKSFQRIK
jgi:hypothetical protein